jgi:probable HAF family extracellular repeat protein
MRCSRLVVLLCLVSLMATWAIGPVAAEPVAVPAIDLGTLGGGTYSEATDVDGRVIVGNWVSADSSQHGFAYDLTTRTMRDIGSLGGITTFAWAVSGNIVVGDSDTPETRHAYAYDVTTGIMRDLGSLGDRSIATDVSGSIVVGRSRVESGSHAFVYDLTTGPMRDIGTLGGPDTIPIAVDGNIVVGHSDVAYGVPHAFAYDATTRVLRDLGTLGGPTSIAVDVDGTTVVGVSDTANGSRHAFVFDLATATMRDLGTFGGWTSHATAVDGTVVVGDWEVAGDYTGFAYDLATGTVTDLRAAIPGARPREVSGTLVVGSSDSLVPGWSGAFAYDLATGTGYRLQPIGGSGSTALQVSGRVAVGSSYTSGDSESHATAWSVPGSEPPPVPTFGGGLQPLPAVNIGYNAGAAIPVPFGLGGFKGDDVFADGSPSWERIPCSPAERVVRTAAGSAAIRGLAYDATTDQYRLTWKTDKAWAGQCWRLTLTFDTPPGDPFDNVTAALDFSFPK